MAVEPEPSDLALLEKRPSFGLLLDIQRQHRLRDAALRLFAGPSATQTSSSELRRVVAQALERLRDAVRTSDLGQDVQTMADTCHGAWIVAAALSLSQGASAQLDLPPAAEVGRRLIDEVAFLLSTLCLEGPSTLRPTLLPCIGLLLQGRGHLLSLHPGLVESLRTGISSTSRALRARSVETVVDILSGPSGEHGTNVIVRQLASLHPELLGLVAADVPASVTLSALRALEGLTSTPVLVPAVALPAVLAECLTGTVSNSSIARRLLLRLIDVDVLALPECLVSGLRRAVDVLTRRSVGPLEVLRRMRTDELPLADLPQGLRCKCTKRLLLELTSLQGQEVIASCNRLPLLGALLFHLLDDLAVDSLGSPALGVILADESDQLEPSLGSCVAHLVVTALSRRASYNVATTERVTGQTAASLAAALDELDVEDTHVACRRAALVAKCKEEFVAVRPATTSSEAIAGSTNTDSMEHPSTAAALAAEGRTVAMRTEPKQASVASSLSSDKPPFAVYDASCDKWRCSTCAEAGRRNPYAKGMTIQASLVSVRMRAHARSTVHKQAEESLQSASELQPSQEREASTPQVVRLSPTNVLVDAAAGGKKRRICGQYFSHDRRICRLGDVNPAPVSAVAHPTLSENHSSKETWQNPDIQYAASQHKRSTLGGA